VARYGIRDFAIAAIMPWVICCGSSVYKIRLLNDARSQECGAQHSTAQEGVSGVHEERDKTYKKTSIIIDKRQIAHGISRTSVPWCARYSSLDAHSHSQKTATAQHNAMSSGINAYESADVIPRHQGGKVVK